MTIFKYISNVIQIMADYFNVLRFEACSFKIDRGSSNSKKKKNCTSEIKRLL